MHHDVSPDLEVVAAKLKENIGVILLYLPIFISLLDHIALCFYPSRPCFIFYTLFFKTKELYSVDNLVLGSFYNDLAWKNNT